MRRFIALALVLALSGCLDPFRPHVPQDLLDNSEFSWIVTEYDQVNDGRFAPKIVQTEYRFYPTDQPPFPAYFLVVGVRGWAEISSTDLLDKTREIVASTLDEQNVTVDKSSEATGGRSLRNGAETSWFRVIGTATSGGLFSNEEEIRVFAETFYDGRSKTAVITISLAQTTETSGLLGVRTEDRTVWNELVGDPFGIIDDMTNENGFAYNLVSHD
jgi:hypothetical protein